MSLATCKKFASTMMLCVDWSNRLGGRGGATKKKANPEEAVVTVSGTTCTINSK